MKQVMTIVALACACRVVFAADDFPKPYSAPCTERENVFEFTEKPAVKNLGNDKYEITFAVKGNCDVTVGLIDPSASSGQGEKGIVVRHLGSGVLGANAPLPFQKNSLKQIIYWNGKDDLDVYHKEPGKLKVRVMLGLKPEFDKRLGGTSPYNIPGLFVWGLTADETGVYVFSAGGWGRISGRKFDHDGKYLQSLLPPPANLPEERLAGLGYVEYEPGKKAPQGRDLYATTADSGVWLSQPGSSVLNECKPFAAAGRVFYGTAPSSARPTPWLHYICTDGGTDVAGTTGWPLPLLPIHYPVTMRFAATPDGKTLYWTLGGGGESSCAVGRAKLDGAFKTEPFLGRITIQRNGSASIEPGSDERGFQTACDVECDAQGRIYVADRNNNRVQIFSPDGKLLKSLAVERPSLLAVHKRTGALYVYHGARVEGKSVARLSKFASWEAAKPELYFDGQWGSTAMALDSWAPKPRFWFGGISESLQYSERSDERNQGQDLVVWEEDGGKFRKLLSFNEEAKKEDGAMYPRQIWTSHIGNKVVCDPTRELVYFRPNGISCQRIFDLRTGKLVGKVNLNPDDIAVDKRGYMHCHTGGGGEVSRYDPTRSRVQRLEYGGELVHYGECPYDYGVEKGSLLGAIPCRCQSGAKGFQDGIGVNMRGDVVIDCNIYHVPKMADEAEAFFTQGGKSRSSPVPEGPGGDYGAFLRSIAEAEKRGEETYSIRRQPGIPLTGATVWTYDRNGELRQECAAVAGELINGVQIDEDGQLYFVVDRQKMYGGKPFLADRAGHFGEAKRETAQFGTLMKTAGKGVKCILPNAPVPLDEMPNRPQELSGERGAWVEGAEWLYAGASPITFGSCSCPTMRFSTDWYKRTFVPEAYRHSIGVVDTAGNLILHIGQYGNFDSGDGAKSRIPVGGDNIGIGFNEFVSTTDNYLVFDDFGERLTVVKLNYHAEETAGIGGQ